MSEKKELSNEELEKVNGGVTGTYDRVNHLSGKLTTLQTYEHQDEYLFFYCPRDYDLIYGKLKRSWELEKCFGLWSWTQYDVEIIESSSSNSDWGPGRNQTFHSNEYEVYTSYSGSRPIYHL